MYCSQYEIIQRLARRVAITKKNFLTICSISQQSALVNSLSIKIEYKSEETRKRKSYRYVKLLSHPAVSSLGVCITLRKTTHFIYGIHQLDNLKFSHDPVLQKRYLWSDWKHLQLLSLSYKMLLKQVSSTWKKRLPTTIVLIQYK